MWKQIENTYYEINEYGVVRNLKSLNILSQRKDKYGYFRISCRLIGGKQVTYTIHRLVAKYFIPNSDVNNVVNHIDGNKENNFYKNLEWITSSENSKHNSYVLLNVGENKFGKPRNIKWNEKRQKWEVYIRINNQCKFFGRFDDKKAAYKKSYYSFLENKHFAPWDENIFHVFSSLDEHFNYPLYAEKQSENINFYKNMKIRKV